MKIKRKTAGELSQKALSDTTKYDALEVGHAMADDIEEHLYKSIDTYKNMIDEDEFCVVMIRNGKPFEQHEQRLRLPAQSLWSLRLRKCQW